VKFWAFIEKYPNTKFPKNLSSRSRVVPCGQTDGRTDRYGELIGAFRSSEKAPRNCLIVIYVNIFIVMYVPFSVLCLLFVCKCVLFYCHRVST
jgi:hypothetical protein